MKMSEGVMYLWYTFIAIFIMGITRIVLEHNDMGWHSNDNVSAIIMIIMPTISMVIRLVEDWDNDKE